MVLAPVPVEDFHRRRRRRRRLKSLALDTDSQRLQLENDILYSNLCQFSQFTTIIHIEKLLNYLQLITNITSTSTTTTT